MLVSRLAGVDFHYRWVFEGQGHGHGQGHIRRGLKTPCGLAVGGGHCGISIVQICSGRSKGRLQKYFS